MCADFQNSQIGINEDEFKFDINNDGLINGYNFIKDKIKYKNIGDDVSKTIFKVDPIKMEKSKLKIKADRQYQNNFKLNIRLTRTGDGIYKNFPEIISLSCGEDYLNCKAYKIGRFNNLWKIWIKSKNPTDIVNFDIDKVPINKPQFFPIQYISLRN